MNEIWYIAEDNSTDFNFYSKRAILAGIYISTFSYWVFNDGNINKTKVFLESQLRKTSKIPSLKSKITILFNKIPDFLNLRNNINKFKQ